MQIMATTPINYNQKTNNNLNSNTSKSDMSFGMNLVLPDERTVSPAAYDALKAVARIFKSLPLEKVFADYAGAWADVAGTTGVYAQHSTRLVKEYGDPNLLKGDDPFYICLKVGKTVLALRREAEKILEEAAAEAASAEAAKNPISKMGLRLLHALHDLFQQRRQLPLRSHDLQL